jgi:hypothetical protein
MFKYQKYLIKKTDQFNPSNYPGIEENLKLIASKTSDKLTNFKTEMLLSFAKGHSIKIEYANDNPQLAEMISSRTLAVKDLEELFESSRNNPGFQKSLEKYVKEWFENPNNY